jgi:hypothetical protein
MTPAEKIIAALLVALLLWTARCLLVYDRMCREDNARRKAERERVERAFQFPPLWHPDPAESHLGRTHVGQHRRAG